MQLGAIGATGAARQMVALFAVVCCCLLLFVVVCRCVLLFVGVCCCLSLFVVAAVGVVVVVVGVVAVAVVVVVAGFQTRWADGFSDFLRVEIFLLWFKCRNARFGLHFPSFIGGGL